MNWRKQLERGGPNLSEGVLKLAHSRIGRWLQAMLGFTPQDSLKLSKYAQPTIELGRFLSFNDFEVLPYVLDAAGVGVCAATFDSVNGVALKKDEVFEVYGLGFSGSMTVQRFYLTDPRGVQMPITNQSSLYQSANGGLVFGVPFVIDDGWTISAYVSAGTPSTSGLYLLGRRLDKA